MTTFVTSIIRAKSLFFFLFAIASISLHAQISTYDLSNYKLNEFRNISLVFTPDFNINFNDNGDNANSFASRLSNDLVFSDYHFRRKKVINHLQSFLMDINNIKDADDIFDFEHRLFYDVQTFKQEKRFIRTITFSNPRYNATVDKSEFYFNGYVSLSKGWGRIEDVTNAWFATQILKDQKTAGFLSDDVPHDVITGLADSISVLRSLRFFDFRHGRINQLEDIARYLIDAEIGFEPGAAAYAHLYDSWSFERFTTRGHGSTFEIGIVPDIFYRRNDWETSTRRITRSYLLPVFARYTSRKAISQKFQSDRTFNIKSGFYVSEFIQDIENYNSYISSSLSLGWRWSYIPSVRTFYSLHPILSYDRLDNLDDDPSESSIRATLNADIRHYFSPRTSLTAFSNWRYTNRVQNPFNFSEGLSFNFGIGLNYNIF